MYLLYISKTTISGDAVHTPLLGCVLSQDHSKVNELADAPDSSTIEQPQTRPALQAPFTVCRRDFPAKMAYYSYYDYYVLFKEQNKTTSVTPVCTPLFGGTHRSIVLSATIKTDILFHIFIKMRRHNSCCVAQR